MVLMHNGRQWKEWWICEYVANGKLITSLHPVSKTRHGIPSLWNQNQSSILGEEQTYIPDVVKNNSAGVDCSSNVDSKGNWSSTVTSQFLADQAAEFLTVMERSRVEEPSLKGSAAHSCQDWTLGGVQTRAWLCRQCNRLWKYVDLSNVRWAVAMKCCTWSKPGFPCSCS